MSDPYAVLGIRADATAAEVSAAYRELAKRHHPDRAPADGARMREINAAYDSILRGERVPVADPAPSATRTSRARPAPAPGGWLAAAVRRQLGRELLEMLQPLEEVLMVTDAATWDSPTVRLVVTDRRLLWLRDDAPVARVRSLRYVVLEEVEGRFGRRGHAELRVKPRDARRMSFAGMRREVVEAVLSLVRPRLRRIPSPSR